ncbi:MAG: imidazoleglycerol-phosphate dehydratase HisB [Deltaproteobacteria bacterium]|nr:imidazoleglycerol-phosphate dehydratase HisB [Deltaproteobacteria bacterium]
MRSAKLARKTTETDIKLTLSLDGKGSSSIDTGIPFFDHMLTLLTRHSLFDLKLKAKGDLEVDLHHTVEDVGLCIGQAFDNALKTKAGIRRYGRADIPMMDSLASVILDLSGRPYFKYNKTKESSKISVRRIRNEFDMGLLREFMVAFTNSAGIDLHITLVYAEDIHHAIESIFKALGRALGEAVSKDPRIKGVLSTKGKL